MNAYMALIGFVNRTNSTDIYCRVAQYILSNLELIKNTGINELSKLCYVSTATITRLCRKIGYGSYSAFKSELAQAVSEFNYKSRYIYENPVMENSNDEGEFYLAKIRHFSKSLENPVSQKSFVR